jgi:hypothetical protein
MNTSSLVIALGALVIGCNDKAASTPDAQPPPQQKGDLGAATFTYQCGPDSDPQCNVDSELAPIATDSQFPTLALGSTFVLQAQRAGDAGTGALVVTPVSTGFIDADATGKLMTAKRAGITTVLATSGADTVDLTTVVITAPDHVKLLQGSPTGSFKNGSVVVGPNGVTAQANVQYTFKFRAFAVDKNDTVLAGALPCNWTTSDATIASITSPPQANIVTVVSGKAGTATITNTIGALPPTTITIKVN